MADPTATLQPPFPGQETSQATASRHASCLGSTCLKWGADGELAPLDLEMVMRKLAKVDQGVAEMLRG